jgi:hypothetical protein
MPYAEFSNVLQIFNHAHAILGSVPLIQVVQPGARKAIATEAVLGFRVQYLLAVLDSTCYAGFRFEAIVALAAGAWFLSLVYAMQRRQFIPQRAISFVEIAVVFLDFIGVISVFLPKFAWVTSV